MTRLSYNVEKQNEKSKRDRMARSCLKWDWIIRSLEIPITADASEFQGRKELEVARAVVRFDVRGRRGRRARRFHKRRFREDGIDDSGGSKNREAFFLPEKGRGTLSISTIHTRNPSFPAESTGKREEMRWSRRRTQYWQVPHGRTQIEIMDEGHGRKEGWKGKRGRKDTSRVVREA